jgi:hypothetical protein
LGKLKLELDPEKGDPSLGSCKKAVAGCEATSGMLVDDGSSASAGVLGMNSSS